MNTKYLINEKTYKKIIKKFDNKINKKIYIK